MALAPSDHGGSLAITTSFYETKFNLSSLTRFHETYLVCSLYKAPNKMEISFSSAVIKMVSDPIPADFFKFWLLTKEHVLNLYQMVKGTTLLMR